MAFPGARPPDRTYRLDANGIGIAVYEWGAASDPVFFCVHGGFDFARTYDVFAPLLADAGWRVVSWDQRGHGNSDHAALNTWEADLRDMLCVIDAVTDRPAVVLGHSKGGALTIQLADCEPHRVSHLINLDGVPVRRRMPDVADHERSRMVAREAGAWLDHRRTLSDRVRKPGTVDELATRRGRMNPRLSHEWLCHLVSVGAREDADGWRWKIDPSMRPGGFGPWRPEWTGLRVPGLPMPFLCLLATVQEEMGWGTTAADVQPLMPARGRLLALEDTGHFLHIERPHLVAGMVLDFVRDHP